MLWLAVQAFVISVWASIFWGTIRLLDRHNPKNSFGLAVGIAAIYAFTHLVAIPDIFYLIAWLIFLMRLTTMYHHLNLLGAGVVTASTILTPYFLMPQIVKFVGDSEARAYLVLLGLPAGVFGTWIVTSLRHRKRATTGEDTALPKARVERGGRVKADKPMASTPTPIAPSAPIVAPKSPDPATPRGDKPTFLS